MVFYRSAYLSEEIISKQKLIIIFFILIYLISIDNNIFLNVNLQTYLFFIYDKLVKIMIKIVNIYVNIACKVSTFEK